ncbi:MAG: DUF4476 domain-containing protein [candidate division WOR-3 bacterium]
MNLMTFILIGQSIEIYGEEDTKEEQVNKEETDDYIWLWKKSKEHTGFIIRILEPEGQIVEIYKEGSKKPIHKADIPTSFERMFAEEGFYKIVIGDWSKKFEIRRGFEYTLYLKKPSRKEEYDDYSIVRKPSKETIIKILEPKGSSVEIYKENSTIPIHKSDIPTSKIIHQPGFYKVIVYNNNSKWEGKIEVKENFENIIYVKNLKPIKQEPKVISEESFSALVNNIKDEISSFTKKDILKTAVDKNYFYTKHLVQLLDLFISEIDKEDVVKMVYPKIIDKENIHQIYSKFMSSISKENIRKWIEEYDNEENNEKKEGWK